MITRPPRMVAITGTSLMAVGSNLARVGIEHGEVGELARLYASRLVVDAERVGGVDGDHAECLVHAHPLARPPHLPRQGADAIHRDPDLLKRARRRNRRVGM